MLEKSRRFNHGSTLHVNTVSQESLHVNTKRTGPQLRGVEHARPLQVVLDLATCSLHVSPVTITQSSFTPLSIKQTRKANLLYFGIP